MMSMVLTFFGNLPQFKCYCEGLSYCQGHCLSLESSKNKHLTWHVTNAYTSTVVCNHSLSYLAMKERNDNYDQRKHSKYVSWVFSTWELQKESVIRVLCYSERGGDRSRQEERKSALFNTRKHRNLDIWVNRLLCFSFTEEGMNRKDSYSVRKPQKTGWYVFQKVQRHSD